MVFTTLKMANMVIFSDLQVAPDVHRPVTLETLMRVATGTDTVRQT